MVARWVRSLACAGAAWIVPSAAFAQAATALDRFEPAPAGDGSFAVPRADVSGAWRTSAALAFSYARAPLALVVRDPSGGQTLEGGYVVGHQLAAHLLAGVEIGRRAKLELDVPFTISQAGDSPSLSGLAAAVPPGAPTKYVSPAGPAMNDVRLGMRLLLLRQRGAIPAASVAYAVWFPTGDATAYTGTGAVRHAPSIVIGAEHGRYAWSVLFGRRLQDSGNGAGLLGGELLGGARLSAGFGPFSAHVELFGSTVTGDAHAFAAGTTSAELLFGGRYTFGPLTAGLAGGPGLGRGVGTPAYRFVATLGASFDVVKEKPPASAAETRGAGGSGKNGSSSKEKSTDTAALSDRDGDGVLDAEDVCPDRVGDPSPKATRRGCPADRDQDRIEDADDRCPDEPGVASPDPARFGCPLDTDGDGLADAVDACPKERGEANADPKKSGCPTSVRVEGTQIVILQEVNFATGSDVIAKDSYALLEQVAAVLGQHAEIARVAIDGHTDNVGAAKANVTLSQKRAVAVVNWLVENGVDARRLEARGFGPRRPIAANDTAEGRAKNRRVEFQILKRSAEGAAGWREGPAQ